MVTLASAWYVKKMFAAVALFSLVEFQIQNLAISLRRSKVQGYMITLASPCCF
jgi:hypothetical protein